MMAYAWLLPALCLLAFIIIVFFGKYLPTKGAIVALLAIASGFVLFLFILRELLFTHPATFDFVWMTSGKYVVKASMIVDQLSVLMLGVVTFCATLIQLYSFGYMKEDPRMGWFFAVLSLFSAAMLGLVLAESILFIYIAWELVGLCSYLLIGFWYDRPAAREASKKAFITTRIGDVGFFIGILILWNATGTFELQAIFDAIQAGQIDKTSLTFASLLIFTGAMGKSGQFPLHVWLPDAMEGPTPVSALIHAATMVAAGIYLVGRTYPLFVGSDPIALNIVMIIGVFTAIFAATQALVMRDVKKVLAYSTVSQLGFMMMSLGAGGFTAAFFHLMTHAFFKACLFLGAGSVIHSTEEQDIFKLPANLFSSMKITGITFIISSLSLSGFPFLAGFWSKDSILAATLHKSPIVFGIALLTAVLSAFYMTRLSILTFFGDGKHAQSHAAVADGGHGSHGNDSHGHDSHGHGGGHGHGVHESPLVMTFPLMALGTLAVLAGFVALPWVGPAFGLPHEYEAFGSFIFFGHPEEEHLDYVLMGISSVAAIVGIGAAWLVYAKKVISAEAVSKQFSGIYKLLINKYYMDDMYQWLIDKVVLGISRFIAVFDRKVVNDIGVNGPGILTVFTGSILKYQQSGKMYNYALAIVLGIIVIVAITAMYTSEPLSVAKAIGGGR